MQTPQERSNSFAFENIPQEIKPLKQWLIWKLTDQGKIPHSPFTGGNCDANDHSNFATFDTAHKAYNKFKLSGIGLAPGNGYALIDFDECINEHGQIDPNVWHIIELLNSYTEITPSGKGIRIIVKAKLAFGRKNFPSYSGFKGEIYVSKGYCTITGNQLPNTPNTINDVSSILNEWLAKIFKEHTNGKSPNPTTTTGGSNSNLTLQLAKRQLDRELVTNSTLAKVWHGQANYKSNSEAVYGLRLDLLRLTYGNEQLANQLFQLSPLYQTNPKKWDRLTQYDYPKALDQIKTELDQPIEPKPQRFTRVSLTDAFNQKPPQWLKEYFLVANESNVLFAPSGMGKTAFAVWLSVQLALEGKRVLYGAMENYPGVAARLKAYTEHLGLDHTKLPLELFNTPFYLNGNGDTDELIRSYSDKQYDLILFDTLTNITKGSLLKDDIVKEAFDAIRRIERGLGCASLTLTHTGWTNQDREAGSMSLRNNSSYTLGLESFDTNKKILNIIFAKTRHHDQNQFPEIRLVLKSATTILQDTEFTGVWAEPDLTPWTFSSKLSTDCLQVLKLLYDIGEASYTVLVDLTKWDKKRLSKTCSTLVGRNLITKTERRSPYELTEKGRVTYQQTINAGSQSG